MFVPDTASSLTPVSSRALVARAAPFAAFIALLALQPLVDERWATEVTLARPLAAAALLAYFWRDYVELRGERHARPADWALAIALGIAIFGAWITFDGGWATMGAGTRGFAPLTPDGRIDIAVAAARLAGLALVVPVMEELFWRSFVMRWIDSRDFLALDPRRVGPLAFALSSALFAAEHSLWFAGLAAGAAYGWLYKRSRDIRIPILSHAITNAILGTWILATGHWSFW